MKLNNWGERPSSLLGRGVSWVNWAAGCALTLGVYGASDSALAAVLVTDSGRDRVVEFSAGGDVSASGTFASGLVGAVGGLCIRPSGQILVTRFSAQDIIDITAGGDFTGATPFATNIGSPLSFICSATQVLVSDYSGGRILDVAAGGDFATATPFATGLQQPVGMQAIAGRLYVLSLTDGLIDVTDGGDYTAAPVFASPVGGTQYRDVEGFDEKILISGVAATTGAVWDVTAGGTAEILFATFPGAGYGMANVDGTLWVISSDGRIYDITLGGTFLEADAFATGILPSLGHAGFNKEPFVLFCGNGAVDSGEDCDDSGESVTCDADCTFADCGDGTINATASEVCDDSIETANCNANCTLVSCGDGVYNATAGESCDDGGNSATCNADCSVATCGDGITNPVAGEACDDTGESATCNVDCTTASCGDGVTNALAGEDCDDTGESATCDNDCSAAACGDANVNAIAGETCDDANDDETDDCLSTCVSATCGDGLVWSDVESCDDGASNSDTEADACRTNCALPSCGDGVVDAPEMCDDGADNSDTVMGACRTSCGAASCGDGVVDSGEECDNGADNSDSEASACRTDCREASCGDGVIDVGEECDEAASNSDSGANACRASCMLPSCGDGVVDSGEGCDLGDDNSDTVNGTCRTSCAPASCGDSVVDPGEECDNGTANEAIADACRETCVNPSCGDGIVDDGEQCDQGTENSDTQTDACRLDCQEARCGDGVEDADEACDDGPKGSKDCSATCEDKETTTPNKPTKQPKDTVTALHGGSCTVSAGSGGNSGGWLFLAIGLGAWFTRRRSQSRANVPAARNTKAAGMNRSSGRIWHSGAPWVTSFAVGASVFIAAPADAQEEGFALNRFEPAERGSEWFSGDSLDLRGNGRVALGVVGDYAYRPLVGYNVEGEGIRSVVRHQFFNHIGVAVNVFDRLRLSASLPLLVFQYGNPVRLSGVVYEADEGFNVGDLRLSADVGLVGTYGDPFTLALGAQVFLPTGSREAYTGDETARVTPHLLAAGDIEPFVASGRVGISIHGLRHDFAGIPFGTDLQLGGTVGVRLLDKRLVIGPELWGSTVISDSMDGFLKENTTPMEWLFGAHYTHEGWRFGAGAGTGLSNTIGTPAMRIVASVEWVSALPKPPPPDTDGDGIFDANDACPTVVGVGSTDPMFNGCPQRTDRDGDGIFDDQDACVDDAGVASAEPSKNGCPTDIDQDGILDRDDACVNVPGVANSDRAKNGCPPDTDGDGVYDAVDACATQAGVANADPKLNGCPPDKDGDGILDATDACPELKGPADPDPTRNGCPRVQVTKERVVILDRIEFDTNKATIRDTSATILGQVFEALRDNPQITLVRIEGHTDSTGRRKSNAELSRLRAMAVVNRLKEMGIEAKRMIAEGLGQEKPIDSNDTEEGRQNNRRVEFHIVKTQPVEPSVK